LHALAATLGVADIVDFLGHREDVPMLLADADVFAFPSRTEAFPNGVIEAMAAGLPVVTSAVGGMLELIEHDRNGLLVPPGDEHALAAAIINVIDRESGADALGRAARATIESRYSFERMVAAFTDLYATELAARAPTTLMARGRLAAAPASHADNPASAS
jgi:glycosyltransferase involved in cell wall biosynthesis